MCHTSIKTDSKLKYCYGLPVLVVFICILNVVKNAETTTTNELFEGDLKIPVEMIKEHYNLSSVPGAEDFLNNMTQNINHTGSVHKNFIRNRRGAGSNVLLWSNRVVRYKISAGMSAAATRNINTAIGIFQSKTCLRFDSVNSGDYIEFINTNEGCYSYVGRQTGKQVINLESPGCNSVGVVLHEIMHAIGFWHEQSRPDRDRYVTIHNENIKARAEHNFLKRKNTEVDSLNSDYDYGSLMHYSSTALQITNCQKSNCNTISVNNITEYRKQGSPRLGQSSQLSIEDIKQINRLYSCYANGFLTVYVRTGTNLPDTDGWLNKPDPYVLLTAVDSQSNSLTRQTSYKQGTQNPVWNENILFGERIWEIFEIRVWDDDEVLSDDPMTMSQHFGTVPGNHFLLTHCGNTNCEGNVTLDYHMDTRVIHYAKLRVYVRYARNLVDTDPIWNNPDPYVRITATQSNVQTATANSKHISGTTNPTWNQWIDFGCKKWYALHLQVMDDDYNSDDAMSDQQFVNLSTGYSAYRRHSAHGSGYLYYDYSLAIDRNDCSPNPCRNGGTCRDGCFSYTCSCRHRYTGTNCQHSTGNLRVTAKYARDLPDRDGWFNDSDPYMEIIAIDVYGNSYRRKTRYHQGNHNPNWNESFDFGYRAWRSIKVKVYDDDYGSDDALSNQETFYLYNYGSLSNIRHTCHRGYAVFDYSYN